MYTRQHVHPSLSNCQQKLVCAGHWKLSAPFLAKHFSSAKICLRRDSRLLHEVAGRRASNATACSNSTGNQAVLNQPISTDQGVDGSGNSTADPDGSKQTEQETDSGKDAMLVSRLSSHPEASSSGAQGV